MKLSVIYNNSNILPSEFTYPTGLVYRAYSVHQIINYCQNHEIEELLMVDEVLNGFSQAFKLLTWLEGELRENRGFKLPKIIILNTDDHVMELLTNLQKGKVSPEIIEEIPSEKDSSIPEDEEE